ncbi:MAG: cell division/cell wall cluster transcriptional repressor MraZ [Alphaproteobacteria bacterium]|nr:cell division/cell wall cluster transcriptional repressor MraZ [Alphaproteobacteria bacterium]
MNLYLSSFTNRIDKKGRVSVPATFRAVLGKEESPGVYASPSVRHPCLECCGPNYFKKLHSMIEAMDPFSPERDAFATMVFGETSLLGVDGEGRIGIPQQLIDYAHLREEVLFVGKGATFEIWDQHAYQDYRKAARSRVQQAFYNGEVPFL